MPKLRCQLDRAVEKVVAAAGDPEQARQLAHNDGEPGTSLEANQNAVADKADENAELEQPGDEAQHRHREGRQACDLRIAHRIPAGQRADGTGDHQRDSRSRTDRELA